MRTAWERPPARHRGPFRVSVSGGYGRLRAITMRWTWLVPS